MTPPLTPQQTFVLVRLSNDPQRRQGPIAQELAALKLVILRARWTSPTPLGRQAVREAWKGREDVVQFEDTY